MSMGWQSGRSRSVGVYGLGNVLLQDDGVGPRVIEELRARYVFPAEVVIEDLGTPGLDLVPYLCPHDVVVIVDALVTSEPSGTVRVHGRDDVLRHPAGPRLSPHDPGLRESLQRVELERGAPLDLRLVGIAIEATGHGTQLSPGVAAALAAAADAVVGELRALGIEASPRDATSPVRPWWNEV